MDTTGTANNSSNKAKAPSSSDKSTVSSKMAEQESDPYQVYRGLYPADKHQEYVMLHTMQHGLNAIVPEHPTHLPLVNDSSIPDSSKFRFEVSYLAKIFMSWGKEYDDEEDAASLSNVLAKKRGTTERMRIVYLHDGLKYQSFPRLGAEKMPGKTTHYYLQIPLSNNGYMYRIIADRDIAQRDISLHKGETHPDGIGGFVELTEDSMADFTPFAEFATAWFGCKAELIDQNVYYNGPYNRVDIVFERQDYPNEGDKVSLEICFEPGYPIKTFQKSTFRIKQKDIDEGKKRLGSVFGDKESSKKPRGT
ncbi:MAG: hypothetical protein SGILL_009207 [Bacillariaceae sp.]